MKAVPIPVAERQRWMQAARLSRQDETFNTTPPQRTTPAPAPTNHSPSAST